MEKGFEVRIVADGYFPYYDIEAKHPDGRHFFVEVKRDEGFKESGNFYLELEALSHSGAPRGKPLLLAQVVDDPGMVAYICDLKKAYKIALDWPIKKKAGEHGEEGAPVPKKYLASHLELVRF